MHQLKAGQIWRKPDGEEIEIIEVLDGMLVEVRFSRDEAPLLGDEVPLHRPVCVLQIRQE